MRRRATGFRDVSRALAAIVIGGLGVFVPFRAATASPWIEVHFSIKVIRDPATGARPSMDPANPASLISDAEIRRVFGRINGNDSLMAAYQRGYRYVVDEIVDIGTLCPSGCTSSNPSYWYGQVFPPPGAGPSLKDFEVAARNNQTAFHWKANAVNLYINWGQGDGAVASFPPPDPRSNHVVVVGSRSLNPAYIPNFAASLVAHEMGHYFGLAHPNAAACKPDECFTAICPNPVPGDGDGLGDTLPDDPCYSADMLSQYHYGKNYAQLNPTELAAIDDILWNNMSYLHPGQDYGQAFMFRLTENQLDRFGDIASADSSRVAVRSGKTWVVSPSGSIFGSGLSTNPFRWPSQGRDAAAVGGGDIVLLKPGVYGQNVVFDRPMTLRVARFGTAVIGN